MDINHFPWGVRPSPLTTLHVIFSKYTVEKQQGMPIGKKLSKAISTGSLSVLDLPTLIYATRNWSVHGVLISSSLRGSSKKFDLWIDTVNLALARILEGASDEIKKRL
jgi:hypothetical protein